MKINIRIFFANTFIFFGNVTSFIGRGFLGVAILIGLFAQLLFKFADTIFNENDNG